MAVRWAGRACCACSCLCINTQLQDAQRLLQHTPMHCIDLMPMGGQIAHDHTKQQLCRCQPPAALQQPAVAVLGCQTDYCYTTHHAAGPTASSAPSSWLDHSLRGAVCSGLAGRYNQTFAPAGVAPAADLYVPASSAGKSLDHMPGTHVCLTGVPTSA